jgi:hypothetical protein
MVDFTSISAGEVTAEPHRVAYWAAEATLRERIRSEMNGLRRADAAEPSVSRRRAIRWRRRGVSPSIVNSLDHYGSASPASGTS